MRQGAGYAVWASEAEIRHRGGIELFWREEAGWKVEGIVNFGPDVASFLLISGSRRWYVAGAYIPPNNIPIVHCVEQALSVAPKRMEAILLGDLNEIL